MTHDLCVICLGVEHAQSALEGQGQPCDHFTVRKLRSHLALFMGDGSQASASHCSGPAAAKIVGFAVDHDS